MPNAKTLIAGFRKHWGKPARYADPSERDLERAPEALRSVIAKDGWASYRDGTLWTCPPAEWNAAPWLEPGPGEAATWLRTGFGDLIAWDGEMFWQVLVHHGARMRLTDSDAWLIGHSLVQPDAYVNDDLPKLMERGREKGSLSGSQIYTFVPALALGGSEEESEVEIAEGAVALDILRQAGSVETIGI
jgi:hypothetical protein